MKEEPHFEKKKKRLLLNEMAHPKKFKLTAGETKEYPVPIIVVEAVVVERVEIVDVVVVEETPRGGGGVTPVSL